MKKAFCTALCFSSIVSMQAQHPAIGGYNVYYGHLHNHSTVSDANGTPDDAYRYAKNTAGLDYFSLADHVGKIEGSEWDSVKAAADRYNEEGVFATFWGFEWSGAGDVAVINTDDYTTISNDPAGTFVELCAWLDARDGLAFFNHPGRSGGFHFNGFSTPLSDKFVGMELFNKTADYSMYYYNDGFYPNDGNLNHYAEANSRGWKIGASGSDDNHAGTWGTRTDYRMAILSKTLSRQALFEAMQARRFYSTLDKNLALSFKMDTCEMGSTIEGAAYDVQIRARDMDEEVFTRVMLFRNGVEMHSWDLDTSEVAIILPVHVFDGEFYYVKATQADGDEAVSSPIFIKEGLVNSHPLCSLTSPVNAAYFPEPQLITLTAEASDTNWTVTRVEFYVNGSSIGSDTLEPYTITYTIPDNGTYEIAAKATDNFGSWIVTSPATVIVGPYSKTEISRITNGMDDVEENAAGGMYTNSSDIELVYDGSNQTIGLRFTGMIIPTGARIESAFIQFTADEASTGTCVLSIRGHAADDSPPFTSASWDISGRATTSAVVAWQPPDWPSVGAAGPDQRTPDLSSIVQEIVNRPGYTRSGAISFIITGTGDRTAKSYEGSSGSAALLLVHYTIGMESSISAQAFDETFVRIYPNPVSGGLLTIEREISKGDTWVTVMDIAGRTCLRSRMENGRMDLDVSGLRTGLYIITLSNDRGIVSRKLVVE